MGQVSSKISLKKIAINGSICSGKSYIGGFLAKTLKVPFFSSDAAIKLVYQSPIVAANLKKYFGNEIFCDKANKNKSFLDFFKRWRALQKPQKPPSSLDIIKVLDSFTASKSGDLPPFCVKKQIFLLKRGLSSHYCHAYKNVPKLHESGINKQYIMQNIINHTQRRKILETILYRRLSQIRKLWICSKLRYSNLLFEVPLLFEKRLAKHYNYSICVFADKNTTQNLAAKRNVDANYLKQMQACQMPAALKAKMSNKIIYNNVVR